MSADMRRAGAVGESMTPTASQTETGYSGQALPVLADVAGASPTQATPIPAVRPALRLEFVNNSDADLSAAVERLLAEGRVVALRPDGQRAQRIARTMAGRYVDLAPGIDGEHTLMPAAAVGRATDAWVLLHDDADTLSAALLDFLDIEKGTIVAPITERHASRLPLFLISIPKAGTHLLFELARAMGYREGGTSPHVPNGGQWYYVEYSNSHTVPRDFFVDTTRKSPFGNRMHPFRVSPALFIYRHPLDILVSEADYYHEEGNTAFSGYLAQLPYEKRLLRLIDDPWLLGTIRDRVGQFGPWLEFPNVIPISFEELVGERGGGSDTYRRRLVWSLQLKLHVGGTPDEFASRAFNPASPTFRSGQLGAHRHRLGEGARERIKLLPSDFIELFGYARALDAQDSYSCRVEEFRRRPLVMQRDKPLPPILIERGCLRHDIVLYRRRFFAIPHRLGHIDLDRVDDLSRSCLASDVDLARLKLSLVRGSGHLASRVLARAIRFGRLVRTWLRASGRSGP